jgi:hypothetical protein
MEWMEINCIIAGLEALIAKYQSELKAATLSEDDRSDLSSDMGYAEILLGKYTEMRDKMRG